MTLPPAFRNARYEAALTWPYLGAALWRMVPVWKAQVPFDTLASDKHWRVYYSDKSFERPMAEVAVILAHEAWHLVRRHFERLVDWSDSWLVGPGGERVSVANLAGDIELNGPLRKDGGKLPEASAFAETFNFKSGLTAEEYAQLLEKGAKRINVHVRCGSCAHGKPEPWEDPAQGDGAPDTVGNAEGKLIARQVAEDIKRAAARGTLSGEVVEWADGVLAPPTVPWQSILRRKIVAAVDVARGKVDYSYRRPSRRPRPPLLTASLVAPEVVGAILGDQSGSMSGTLGLVRSEAEGVIKALGGRAWYIGCDAEVKEVQRVRSMREVKKHSGWGGTDMRVGIEKALALRPRAGVIVCLTDSYTPWPERATPVPLIVCVVEHGTVEGVPGWAQVVKVKGK